MTSYLAKALIRDAEEAEFCTAIVAAIFACVITMAKLIVLDVVIAMTAKMTKISTTNKPERAGMSDLSEIRRAIADYKWSEGCSCCRDNDAHEEAGKRLGKLLRIPKYKDGSGYDWSRFRTKRPAPRRSGAQ